MAVSSCRGEGDRAYQGEVHPGPFQGVAWDRACPGVVHAYPEGGRAFSVGFGEEQKLWILYHQVASFVKMALLLL